MIDNNSNINFGYKAYFKPKAFKSFANEMRLPLNTYSLKVLDDVDKGFDSFNSKLSQRKGVPNLNKGAIEVDYFQLDYNNARCESEQKIKFGFIPKGLPEKIQKYIQDDAISKPESYIVPIKHSEYNKNESSPFEEALNKMFVKIKTMIEKYDKIEQGLGKIYEKHVQRSYPNSKK